MNEDRLQMSEENLLNKIIKSFNPAAANFKAVYLFEVEDIKRYFLKIDEGTCQILTEFDGEADVSLKADEETWNAIATGEVSAQMAFMMGKLSLDGELPLALKLPSIFNLG